MPYNELNPVSGTITGIVETGKVTSKKLELFFGNKSDFPETGSENKLYIAVDENSLYRYSAANGYVKTIGGGFTPDMPVVFFDALERTNINSGDELNTMLGKLHRVVADLRTVAFSGSYNDLDDKPQLFSGSYDDLDDKPQLFSGSYDDLEDKPQLFSGSYDDLSDKPAIPVITSGTAALEAGVSYLPTGTVYLQYE